MLFFIKIKRGGRVIISNSKLFLILLVLTILSTIISAIVLDNGVTVNEIQNCYEELYNEIEDIFDNVSKERDVYDNCIYHSNSTVCADQPLNTSCVTNTTEIVYQCVIGKESYQSYEKVGEQVVQKSKTTCDKKSYEIDIAGSIKKIDFDKAGYYCSLDGNIITCDSVHDGNGDGICKSGETCIKFEITSGGINTIQKRIDSIALKDIEVEDV